MFAKYEKFVDSTLENLFKDISYKTAKSLLEAKKSASGSKA